MLLTLFFVQLAGLVSPGPDFFYISRRAASSNSRNAIFAAIGISLGVAFWAIVVIFGFGLLIKEMPFLNCLIMILGGSFLSYTGFKMARVKENAQFDEKTFIEKTSAKKEILDGLMINLANAKVVVFFSSILSGYASQLVNIEDYFLVLAMLSFSTLIYFSLVALLFSRQVICKFYAKYNRYIDNVAGLVFLFFGLNLIYNGLLFFV
ncbi:MULTISPECIES: LysE family transporter [Pasteurellaceae]|uniref:LysE family transporter n=1 Tax=Pasteurella atlantica TaxID=2827233 RepID=A0AAW8CRY7_9PAST|nr:LysE family transporter [Pasteurella atlantica]MBR0574288.1 LysE family transporter [Pasteurella atlantica]MDP8040192.1 LysE family transporter [Pasteurella atlantica]MDP8042285.1 LysE family transporter [Pasteurella atlantica]MDP8044498.1 LysE family transporter [Pasteurella atlantica]MDP8046490.1 LysE family transporter [Pasteurella atlantica]